MKKNVGFADKLIRIILAAIIVSLSYAKILTGILEIVLLTLAVILVLTIVINFCPIWALLGVRTVPKPEKYGKPKEEA